MRPAADAFECEIDVQQRSGTKRSNSRIRPLGRVLAGWKKSACNSGEGSAEGTEAIKQHSPIHVCETTSPRAPWISVTFDRPGPPGRLQIGAPIALHHCKKNPQLIQTFDISHQSNYKNKCISLTKPESLSQRCPSLGKSSTA